MRMPTLRQVVAFALVLLLPACASFQTTGQVQAGRRALLVNDPEAALPYFLEAAKRDPDFVYISEDFREGIWTYVGRTQYATKRYQDARQSLEHALANDRDDNMARLYYGLTLVRLGDSARGVKEIESAMQGIHDWLEYMERTRPFQAFWDPLREIRKTIENDLDRSPGKDVGRENLIADAEWLGNKMETEIERVRQDERRQYERDFENRRGPSVGIGIGF
jgi:tetratricopeptide (TPR) repeat protein